MFDLIIVFGKARLLLARDVNNFDWSSWEDRNEALAEIDSILSQLQARRRPDESQMRVIFAPTGPMQEVSISSGWGQAFIELAAEFDAALVSLTQH